MKLFFSSRTGIIVVLLIVFFAVLNLTPLNKGVKNFFYSISSPIQKTLWNTGSNVSDFFEAFGEIKNLKIENKKLKLEIQDLLAKNAVLKEIEIENKVLREALAIGLEKDFKLVLAQVVSKDVSQDFILINKGSQDNISKDLPVITPQKVFLGKIYEVYPNFSKVQLSTHKESSFNVKIAGKEIFGVVKGKGNSKLFLDFVPHEKEIKKGDKIITTSLGGIFPKDLLIGEIQEVIKLDIKPFQTAEVKPFFNIKETQELFIIMEF